jgi:uncharacterized protein with ATP-grasp and redox domains
LSTPPEIGDQVHRLVRQEVGDADPYRAIKEASTRYAQNLYPRMKALLAEADDPLDVAVRLSIAGNIIDAGPDREYDLWDTVERVLVQPFAIDDGDAFREALARVDQGVVPTPVLYLADNAGETVFDRLLIETLDAPVVYAVKGGPTLNDATAPGTVLERAHGRACSDQFRQLYDQAELVIAKGQANYETLSEEGPKVFCLLQAKCPVIARDVGAPVGSIVLSQRNTGEAK